MTHRQASDPDLSRRRFLVGLSSLAGLGTVGLIIRNALRRFGGANEVAASIDQGSPSTVSQAPSTLLESPTTTVPRTTPSTEVSTTASTTEATTTTTEPAETTTTTTEQPTTTTTSAAPPAGSLLVLERASWTNDAQGSGFVSHSINQITVHHTAALLQTNSRAPGLIRQHQVYHQSQGWPDLAYHFMIDFAGNIYEGRPYAYRGDTFTSYDPSGHFLPCFEGDYRTETPTSAQTEALAQLCAWVANKWGIDPSTISGHRDHASTSCPGDNVYALIEGGTLAARVSEILGTGIPSLGYLRGEAAAAAVAAIEAG